MMRFLENRDDHIWVRQGRLDQNASRNDELRTVLDRLDQLQWPGKDREKKADK